MIRDNRTRKKWCKSLRVGDVVQDCNYRNVVIAEIYVERYLPRWMQNLIYWLLPDQRASAVIGLLEKTPLARYHDSTLVMENGASCSALSCCDPVGTPHE